MAYASKLQAATSELETVACLAEEVVKEMSWKGVKHLRECMERVESQMDCANTKWEEYIGSITDQTMMQNMAPRGPRELFKLSEKLNQAREKI